MRQIEAVHEAVEAFFWDGLPFSINQAWNWSRVGYGRCAQTLREMADAGLLVVLPKRGSETWYRVAVPKAER